MEAGLGAAGTSGVVAVPLMPLPACEEAHLTSAPASAELCLEVHGMFRNILELQLHPLGKDVPVSLPVPISATQQPHRRGFGLAACRQRAAAVDGHRRSLALQQQGSRNVAV